MNKKIRFVAELAILYSVPHMTDATDNSKLSGLQRKLQKQVSSLYTSNLLALGAADTKELTEAINAWGKATGWEKKQRKVATVLCFCAEMIDRSPNKLPTKCINIITDLIDHLNKKNRVYTLSLEAGTIAANKWEKLFNV